jgi:hypothetical protein
MIALFRLLCLAPLLLASPAWAGSIALLLADKSAPYQEFQEEFQRVLRGSDWQIQSISQAGEHTSLSADLIVSVGTDALPDALARRPAGTPLLATLLPRAGYNRALGSQRSSERLSAIVLDQPPARLAALMRHLLPEKTRFGIVHSSETRSELPPLRRSFALAGYSLDVEIVDSDVTLLPALDALLPRIDALLAIPDSQIYRRETIKPLLVTTYRYRRPLIAFSPALVKAGALAALYSSPGQIGRQTGELILNRGSNLPAPQAPAYFSIAINQSVADAFNLPVSDENRIYRALLADRTAQ